MVRPIGGVAAGVIAWIVVVTVLNLGLRHGWSDYAAVEKAMTFTVSMKIARLAMSGVSSLVGGVVAGAIDRRDRAPLVSGLVLLLVFVPVHYALWQRFPVWYHLAFLTSLPALAWAGGRLVPRRAR